MGTAHSKKEKTIDTSTPVKKSFSNAGKIYSSFRKGKAIDDSKLFFYDDFSKILMKFSFL